MSLAAPGRRYQNVLDQDTHNVVRGRGKVPVRWRIHWCCGLESGRICEVTMSGYVVGRHKTMSIGQDYHNERSFHIYRPSSISVLDDQNKVEEQACSSRLTTSIPQYAFPVARAYASI